MLNLSPIGSAEALSYAYREAMEILERSGREGVLKLLADARRIYDENSNQLRPALKAFTDLSQRIVGRLERSDLTSRTMRRSVAALVYLRNPYDRFFDTQSVGGFDDDIRVLTDAAD